MIAAIGFIGGVAVMKILHHFEPPRVVEIKVPIPERAIPITKPRMRDVRRDPQTHGRREIF